jgi:hypothetical protein
MQNNKAGLAAQLHIMTSYQRPLSFPRRHATEWETRAKKYVLGWVEEMAAHCDDDVFYLFLQKQNRSRAPYIPRGRYVP